jgi:uncharacterized protein YbgA (DUF1722 family)
MKQFARVLFLRMMLHTELSHGNSSITLVVFHSRQRQDLLAIDTSKIMYKCLGILVAKVGTFSHFFLQ